MRVSGPSGASRGGRDCNLFIANKWQARPPMQPPFLARADKQRPFWMACERASWARRARRKTGRQRGARKQANTGSSAFGATVCRLLSVRISPASPGAHSAHRRPNKWGPSGTNKQVVLARRGRPSLLTRRSVAAQPSAQGPVRAAPLAAFLACTLNTAHCTLHTARPCRPAPPARRRNGAPFWPKNSAGASLSTRSSLETRPEPRLRIQIQ